MCDSKSCGEHGLKCSQKKCACPGGATTETSCSDGVDNNCAGTNSLCPGYPSVICRIDTPNANVCAQTTASACPSGQTFVDVTGGPNYCHY